MESVAKNLIVMKIASQHSGNSNLTQTHSWNREVYNTLQLMRLNWGEWNLRKLGWKEKNYETVSLIYVKRLKQMLANQIQHYTKQLYYD